MDTDDRLFDYIHALSNEAEARGLRDLAMVLEFALDVYLKETGRLQEMVDHDGPAVEALPAPMAALPEAPVEPPTPSAEILELAPRRAPIRPTQPSVVASVAWPMARVPLAADARHAVATKAS